MIATAAGVRRGNNNKSDGGGGWDVDVAGKYEIQVAGMICW